MVPKGAKTAPLTWQALVNKAAGAFPSFGGNPGGMGSFRNQEIEIF